MPVKKVATKKAIKKVGSVNAKKAASFLSQLKKAGAIVTMAPQSDKTSLKSIKAKTKLTEAELRNIGASKAVDFTAWVAWTLRF